MGPKCNFVVRWTQNKMKTELLFLWSKWLKINWKQLVAHYENGNESFTCMQIFNCYVCACMCETNVDVYYIQIHCTERRPMFVNWPCAVLLSPFALPFGCCECFLKSVHRTKFIPTNSYCFHSMVCAKYLCAFVFSFVRPSVQSFAHFEERIGKNRIVLTRNRCTNMCTHFALLTVIKVEKKCDAWFNWTMREK